MFKNLNLLVIEKSTGFLFSIIASECLHRIVAKHLQNGLKETDP
jgi:hypothetical protein